MTGLAWQAVKANFAPARAAQLLTFVAFPTSVAASSANCYIIRRPEIETGLPVLGKDKNGAWNEVLADGFKSNIAAAKAVYATTASRAFLQFPVFFVPPLLMSVLPAMGKKSDALALLLLNVRSQKCLSCRAQTA